MRHSRRRRLHAARGAGRAGHRRVRNGRVDGDTDVSGGFGRTPARKELRGVGGAEPHLARSASAESPSPGEDQRRGGLAGRGGAGRRRSSEAAFATCSASISRCPCHRPRRGGRAADAREGGRVSRRQRWLRTGGARLGRLERRETGSSRHDQAARARITPLRKVAEPGTSAAPDTPPLPATGASPAPIRNRLTTMNARHGFHAGRTAGRHVHHGDTVRHGLRSHQPGHQQSRRIQQQQERLTDVQRTMRLFVQDFAQARSATGQGRRRRRDRTRAVSGTPTRSSGQPHPLRLVESRRGRNELHLQRVRYSCARTPASREIPGTRRGGRRKAAQRALCSATSRA